MTSITIGPHHIDVLYDEATIAERIDSLAAEIAGMDLTRLLVVPILKGSFMFAADLIRAMHKAGLRPEVDFLMLSSYRTNTVSSGAVNILRDIETDVSGRGILLVDDILESGRTLAFAKDLIMARGAEEVRTAVLLEKPMHRAVAIDADAVGFNCPDCFVIGYGMDMAHHFRELPFVGVLRDPAPTSPDQ
ncbi:hypoxanthine phosphoribosyltransferase [Rhodoligotrophos appendicifer]|uniref:hypoxanthine phosphoribosyltransferase n=1 Tax=Rhodoligotrophos appendicifer TaxID=987056 RepID=UPI0011851B58|nr:hypoxanthine phosphoribosyltransferase [Rhodoligotrophos appendicifer]